MRLLKPTQKLPKAAVRCALYRSIIPSFLDRFLAGIQWGFRRKTGCLGVEASQAPYSAPSGLNMEGFGARRRCSILPPQLPTVRAVMTCLLRLFSSLTVCPVHLGVILFYRAPFGLNGDPAEGAPPPQTPPCSFKPQLNPCPNLPKAGDDPPV